MSLFTPFLLLPSSFNIGYMCFTSVVRGFAEMPPEISIASVTVPRMTFISHNIPPIFPLYPQDSVSRSAIVAMANPTTIPQPKLAILIGLLLSL